MINNFAIQGKKPAEIPTWKRIQRQAHRAEEKRRQNLSELPDMKPIRDAELEKIVFSDSELGQMMSELEEVWGEL